MEIHQVGLGLNTKEESAMAARRITIVVEIVAETLLTDMDTVHCRGRVVLCR